MVYFSTKSSKCNMENLYIKMKVSNTLQEDQKIKGVWCWFVVCINFILFLLNLFFAQLIFPTFTHKRTLFLASPCMAHCL